MIAGKGAPFPLLDQSIAPFEPDVILPAQMLAARRTTPEKRLMIAVLEDAILCFRKYRLARRGSARRLFLEAEKWLLSPGTEWAFSFENICNSLDLHADHVRHQLWKELGDH